VYFIKYFRLKIAEAGVFLFFERRNFLVLKLLDHTTDQDLFTVAFLLFCCTLVVVIKVRTARVIVERQEVHAYVFYVGHAEEYLL